MITQTALELGFLYALVAMALFLSFRILNIADMTTDGCFVLGAAVSVTLAAGGHPILAIPAAMLAGSCAGFVTAFLQTRLGIPSILAGIVTNTGLYTVNLMAMGWKANQSLLGGSTIFTLLRDSGIETVMLTGDAEESAKAVAGAVGIREVHAGLLPQQKLARLQSIRETKGAAMFVGDGINDAPVLAGADVGAAMGSGADAAIEAADVVFMTSDVAAVPQALRISRQTARIAWQNVVFALAVKLAVMILGLCGYASMWLAVIADSGVALLCVLNSIRILYKK